MFPLLCSGELQPSLFPPISVRPLNGLLIPSITLESTPSVSLIILGNHGEVIELYLLDSPSPGHPRLGQHNPHMVGQGFLSSNLLQYLPTI